MKKVLVIAEIGVNHNGSISLAKKLIIQAKKAGANYAKFQTFKSENVFSIKTPKAQYQIKKTNKNETALEMAKKLELTFNEHKLLKKFCDKNKIKYLSTYHDIYSLKNCYIDMDFMKISSGDLNNFPFILEIIKMKKPILLSTGASTMNEIKQTVDFIIKKGFSRKNLILMQCNSSYPTPIKDSNISVLNTYKNKFKTKVGFSDHTIDLEPAIVAVSHGASIIEKHFTLNQNLSGPDHKASLNPIQLKNMIIGIGKAILSIGDCKKKITKSEKLNRKIIRKSIFSSKNIRIGEKFTMKNLQLMRPGNGLEPKKIFNLLGKKSKILYKKNQLIQRN
jgi:N,N'-diacetyllegionaminate synthase